MQWLDYVIKFFSRFLKTNHFKKKFRTKSIKKLINIIDNPKWQIVDIRNSLSFSEHHLKGSINIPVTTFNYKYFKEINKDSKILILDNNYRSHLTIYKTLKSKGFKSYLLYGNYDDIRNNPLFENFTEVVIY